MPNKTKVGTVVVQRKGVTPDSRNKIYLEKVRAKFLAAQKEKSK